MRINQNIEAFNAYRNVSMTNSRMAKSLEKLSSGFRINRAADDVAGLVISQGLRAQISGLRQATRNAQDGISVVQTAEGALNEVHSMLNRMRDLAVQASNTGTNDTAARTAAQAEINALSAEISRVASSTKFGGQSLLDGSFGVVAAQVTGFNATASYTADAADVFTINVDGGGAVSVSLTAGAKSGTQLASQMQAAIRSSMTNGGYSDAQAASVTVSATNVGSGFAISIKAGLEDGETFVLADTTGTLLGDLTLTGTVDAADGTGGTFQVGSNAGEVIDVTLATVSAAGLGVDSLNMVTSASAAITAVDAAITAVSTIRGDLGAVQNRFESTINNLQVTTENLAASESRIRDTDMALEMTNFTRNQIMAQAGTAMLAQANQIPAGILQLLR